MFFLKVTHLHLTTIREHLARISCLLEDSRDTRRESQKILAVLEEINLRINGIDPAIDQLNKNFNDLRERVCVNTEQMITANRLLTEIAQHQGVTIWDCGKTGEYPSDDATGATEPGTPS